jgi:hypothetical protein
VSIMPDPWASLNARQRAYLRTLYDCDQDTEALRRDRAARGDWDRMPASEWRWQLYGPTEPPSQLYVALLLAKLVDQGTGATWRALEDRGLAKCRDVLDAFGVSLLQVQITPAGRKLVRAATGEQRPKAPPKGQLHERQWAAVARLYMAGNVGEVSEEMMHHFDWMRTLLRLRDYQPQPLMEEFSGPWNTTRLRLTPLGRAYYEREWARYHALYPDVDAPQPSEDA